MVEDTPTVETEEQVDLDGDNYIEEMMDDDVEEPTEEDRVEGGEDELADEEQEASKTESRNDPSLETDKIHHAVESVEDGEKPAPPIDEEDKEKFAELLALPAHGSEIFIGGLPREVTEDDLRDLCEPIGNISEIRLMKDKDRGESKGYAFVTFNSKDLAKKAIEELHNKEFKGRTLRCSLSQTKHRLFIGNIPKSWSEAELRKVIEENGPGVENIELLKDPQNPSRNRGFAFIEYYNNACADYARQKMSNVNFKLDGNTPTVSWADPKSAPDSSAAAQVKALYVKNLPDNTTTEQLKELFQRHGEVTKVVLPIAKAGQSKREFGFIHFAERSSALKAVKETEKYEIAGQVLDVSLAKPQNDKKSDAAFSYKPGAVPNYLPYAGYGLVGNPYGTLGSGYGAATGFQQPVIYGRGPMPAGMQMVPMVLPDGRIGYVLQQPGAPASAMPGRMIEAAALVHCKDEEVVMATVAEGTILTSTSQKDGDIF
ncbi:heterogeneous nuclear ribonucleoprotein Q-like [Telopea speciosissima]|uniref:heterogeneous nuclear ribonucleoprotein Q-like n=1 Tax=Telopea speciosissima TaxID=54955 RepID=UPI001CC6ABC6|nr:heterogeneous nuclear ribonucleoprotein Q-like [Telopea speciosissima]XP_043717467.1 heterogeneous nuclear ribonucleoprotein Q-like [Telopea speciosissima]